MSKGPEVTDPLSLLGYIPVARAPLPDNYEAAVDALRACAKHDASKKGGRPPFFADALRACAKHDECQAWDPKEALASYARQAAEADAIRRMAVRIQVRAIRRCGELLKEIERDIAAASSDPEAAVRVREYVASVEAMRARAAKPVKPKATKRPAR